MQLVLSRYAKLGVNITRMEFKVYCCSQFIVFLPSVNITRMEFKVISPLGVSTSFSGVNITRMEFKVCNL